LAGGEKARRGPIFFFPERGVHLRGELPDPGETNGLKRFGKKRRFLCYAGRGSTFPSPKGGKKWRGSRSGKTGTEEGRTDQYSFQRKKRGTRKPPRGKKGLLPLIKRKP